MLRSGLMMAMVVVTATSSPAWTQSAYAFPEASLDLHNRARLAQEGRLPDLQVLQREQRRLQFQQQQQRYREQDRGPIGYQQPRPRIPVMRRNCQVQPYGNN